MQNSPSETQIPPKEESYPWVGSIIMTITFIMALFLLVQNSKISQEQVNKIDQLYTSYEQVITENELLWTYIENIDTFTSLDDAVKYRDDLIEQLQFLDE